MTQKETKNITDSPKIHWLHDIPTFGGTLMGIIFTAIGGVMVIQTVLKVYVFGFTTESYFNAEEQCDPSYYDNRFAKPIDENTEQIKSTPEEIEACVEKRTKRAEEDYIQGKKETLVDGVSFLFVGLMFWNFLRRRKKSL